jgi:hypothetical protein
MFGASEDANPRDQDLQLRGCHLADKDFCHLFDAASSFLIYEVEIQFFMVYVQRREESSGEWREHAYTRS